MDNIGINRVLGEMRALQQRSQLPAAQPVAEPARESGFVDALRDAVHGVNDRQMDAARAAEDFQLGRGNLAETMLKMQESGIAFRAAVEARNRAVSAYQTIMNMPL